MARIVDDAEIVESRLREAVELSLGPLSARVGGSAPTFVTYFNRSLAASTADVNLDNAYETIGGESPVRYGRVEGFPLYGLEGIQLDPQDGDFGAESDVSIQAIVLPGTVLPLVDDYVVVPAGATGPEQAELLFRVTSVSSGSADSKRFHRIQMDLTPGGVDGLLRQVSGEYVFSVGDHENNRRPVLLRSDAVTLSDLRDLREAYAEWYLRQFSTRGLPVISIPWASRDGGAAALMSYHVHLFCEIAGVFRFDRPFYSSACGFDLSDRHNRLAVETELPRTIYGAVLSPSERGLVTSGAFVPSPVRREPFSVYSSFPEEFLECRHVHGDWTGIPGAVPYCGHDLPLLAREGILSGEGGMVDAVLRYVAADEVPPALAVEMAREAVPSATLEGFLFTPCVLRMLRVAESMITSPLH